MKSKFYNGIEFHLVENPYYKKSKDCFECKYKVMYYNDYYDSHMILYHCNSKKEFTLKNIKEFAYRILV